MNFSTLCKERRRKKETLLAVVEAQRQLIEDFDRQRVQRQREAKLQEREETRLLTPPSTPAGAAAVAVGAPAARLAVEGDDDVGSVEEGDVVEEDEVGAEGGVDMDALKEVLHGQVRLLSAFDRVREERRRRLSRLRGEEVVEVEAPTGDEAPPQGDNEGIDEATSAEETSDETTAGETSDETTAGKTSDETTAEETSDETTAGETSDETTTTASTTEETGDDTAVTASRRGAEETRADETHTTATDGTTTTARVPPAVHLRLAVETLESAQAATLPAASPAGASASSLQEMEEEWFRRQMEKLERYKERLTALRLDGDEFHVHWRKNQLGISTWGERLFEITPTSKLFVHRVVDERNKDGEFLLHTQLRQKARRSSQHLHTEVVEFRVDQVRRVRHTSETAGGKGKGIRVALQGKDAVELVCDESDELVEVLGAHMRQYRTNRMRLVNELSRLHELKATAFDQHNDAHVARLLLLWENVFGEPIGGAVDDAWSRIGFQSRKPASDFRGMGMAGLECLIYFSEHNVDFFRHLVSTQAEREYPVAAAGINLTNMLYQMLSLRDAHDEVAASDVWDASPLFTFMVYARNTSAHVFEDMYLIAFHLLEKTWVEMNATYFDFPNVLASVRKKVELALEKRPTTLGEIRALMGMTDDDGATGSPTDTNTSSSDTSDAL